MTMGDVVYLLSDADPNGHNDNCPNCAAFREIRLVDLEQAGGVSRSSWPWGKGSGPLVEDWIRDDPARRLLVARALLVAESHL